MESLINSYGNEDLHRRVGEVIKAHSVNQEDIRAVVERFVDWSSVRRILDLGCGYGWLESSLDGGFETIFGVDALEENAKPFLATAKAKAQEAGFERITLPALLPFESESFDLVIAVYSLYFFPGILPEVERLLKPDGVFLALTHSEGMLEEGEEFFHFKNLRGLIECFSGENGEGKLKQHFTRVRYIDYVNSLFFGRDDGEDLALYIAFKAEFISKDVDPAEVTHRLLRELDKRGTLSFNKNDRIFLAQK
jgi:SAM-dependent methyltransferase